MNRVKGITKQTDNRYLNMYEFAAERRNGKVAPYFMASRQQDPQKLKAVTHECKADGVIIYGVYGENKDKVVLIKQFRYPINAYVYEFPAGLVEQGEDMFEAGIREIYEETGLTFVPKKVSDAYTRPYFTTVGVTDEACGTVYGYCSGIPSNCHQEESEDIEIVLADREECKRILKEENVAIKCAYMLMHFIHCNDGDPLAFLDEM
ncbi:MAG: NUDIX hydrolase [Lachnospiraceae bacterium]|nr:NUDIX hydrolase [Lachnospiraceae bacterium]